MHEAADSYAPFLRFYLCLRSLLPVFRKKRDKRKPRLKRIAFVRTFAHNIGVVEQTQTERDFRYGKISKPLCTN